MGKFGLGGQRFLLGCVNLPHRNQWNFPYSASKISEIYWSTVKFADQPVSFSSDISKIPQILCGRLIKFEILVFHSFGFREHLRQNQ